MRRKKIWMRGLGAALALTTTCSFCVPAYAEADVAAQTDSQVLIQDGVSRIYGANRYDTAFRASDQWMAVNQVSALDTVIIASGTGFADALAGSYLACVKSAPILMTDSKDIRGLESYIKKNCSKNATIYILGGKAAVGDSVEMALRGIDKTYQVKRLSGASRYETNIEILKEAGVEDQDLLVCTGKKFADSLSASAVGKPILLVGNQLEEQQQTFLQTADVDQVYVIGGAGAVSDGVQQSVSGYDADGTVDRIYGRTRYETSVRVAEKFFDCPSYAVAAYAQNFPDGLCGGPLAYSCHAPLILTNTGAESVAAGYTNRLGICYGTVLGGKSLISDEAARRIFKKTESAEQTGLRYTTNVSTTLHVSKDSASDVVAVPYMTPLTLLSAQESSGAGQWLQVEYQGKPYYLWQPAGADSLTSEKSKYVYVTDTELQRNVVDVSLSIYWNWETKYAHQQSNGVADADGKYGFDCSGFVSYVMNTAMRRVVPTYRLSANIETLYKTTGIYNAGLKGAYEAETILTGTLDETVLQPGDVLFFQVGNEESVKGLSYNHCGIYLGKSEFIHCTSSWGGGVCIMPLKGIYKEGFVTAKRYLPESVTKAEQIKYTTSQKTAVYHSRNSNYTPVAVLRAEVPVTVLFTDNGNWSYVEYESGKYGFILSKYLQEKKAEVSEKRYTSVLDLKLYTTNDTSSKYITVPIGTEVEYIGRYSTSSYYKVMYQGNLYYIYAPTGIESRLTDDYKNLMDGCGTVVIHTNTKLRTSMDSKSDDNLIRMMYQGEEAVLIAQSDSKTWCYIKTEDGTYGYVLCSKLNTAN